jgi:uncharacterized membrane protein
MGKPGNVYYSERGLVLAKKDDMEKDTEIGPTATPSINKVNSVWYAKFSEMFSQQEKWLDRMGKYSWITNANQIIIGLALIYGAIWLAKPYLSGWVIVLATILFISGSFYGWYTSRQTDIHLTESGAAIFSYTGLWVKFIPMFVILFILRTVLVYLDSQEIIDSAPMMRTLTFFIAGVFTARAITLLVKIFQLKNTNPLSNDVNVATNTSHKV